MEVQTQGCTEKSELSNWPLYENEMYLMRVCADIEQVGLKLDLDFVLRAIDFENEEIKKEKENFAKITGRTFHNSPKLFAEVFATSLSRLPLTDGGKPSFASDALEFIDHPAARCVEKIRYYEKRLSSFWSSFMYYSDSFGVLHPKLNQAGTVSGRFSSSNPNMQNLSRDEDGTDFPIRRAFVPRPLHKFYTIDYSQLEYRLLVNYARETSLIDAINAGEDVHTATARMLGISRYHAKTVNFALLYGSGIEKLSHMLKIPVSEAKDIKALYFSRLPNIKRFIKNVQYKAETRGYVYNMFGRKVYCSKYEYSYKMVNHLIQGAGADLVKHAMVRVHKEVTTSMRLQVHDELVLELRDNEAHLVDQVKEIMETTYIHAGGVRYEASAQMSDKSLAKVDLQDYEGKCV